MGFDWMVPKKSSANSQITMRQKIFFFPFFKEIRFETLICLRFNIVIISEVFPTLNNLKSIKINKFASGYNYTITNTIVNVWTCLASYYVVHNKFYWGVLNYHTHDKKVFLVNNLSFYDWFFETWIWISSLFPRNLKTIIILSSTF